MYDSTFSWISIHYADQIRQITKTFVTVLQLWVHHFRDPCKLDHCLKTKVGKVIVGLARDGSRWMGARRVIPRGSDMHTRYVYPENDGSRSQADLKAVRSFGYGKGISNHQYFLLRLVHWLPNMRKPLSSCHQFRVTLDDFKIDRWKTAFLAELCNFFPSYLLFVVFMMLTTESHTCFCLPQGHVFVLGHVKNLLLSYDVISHIRS